MEEQIIESPNSLRKRRTEQINSSYKKRLEGDIMCDLEQSLEKCCVPLWCKINVDVSFDDINQQVMKEFNEKKWIAKLSIYKDSIMIHEPGWEATFNPSYAIPRYDWKRIDDQK